jgi:2-(1,2-epoxy-1,2-dihydrophenyl)acetyl-CoA isomerase
MSMNTPDWETVMYRVEDGVALIALNRPAKLNAFNRALRADLLAALTLARDDDRVRVIVLTGAGRSFSSGADLSERREGDTIAPSRTINEEYRPIIESIRTTPKLVVGAVNGAAAGIGTALVLACDLLVMADDAYLLEAFADIGLVPDGGVTWFLARSLGIRIATELMLDPSKVGAERCLELGLINRIVPAERLVDETLSWAKALAQRAPLPQREVKRLMAEIFELSLSETIEREAQSQDVCASSEDFRSAVRAFLEKRARKRETGEPPAAK